MRDDVKRFGVGIMVGILVMAAGFWCAPAAQGEGGQGSSGDLFQVGQSVCYHDRLHWLPWFSGTVKSITDDEYCIDDPSYGYEICVPKPDVWVFENDFHEGDLVWSTNPNFSNAYFVSTVLDVQGNQYKVRPIEYADGDYDAWLDSCSVFPLPEVGDYGWVRCNYTMPCSGIGLYMVKIMGIDTVWSQFDIHYVGYDLTFDDMVAFNGYAPASPAQLQAYLPQLLPTDPMELPTESHVFSYGPTRVPVLNSDPKLARPIAVGDVANGGRMLSLQVSIPSFFEPYDAYLAIAFEATGDMYLIDNLHRLRPLSDPRVFYCRSHESVYNDVIVDGLNTEGTLPPGRYDLFLLVAPQGSLDPYYLWSTYFVLNEGGSQSLIDVPEISPDDLLDAIRSRMEEKARLGGSQWQQTVEAYLSDYRNDQGEPDVSEALGSIEMAAYYADNLNLYCWAALRAVVEDPEDVFALNSAAVCLMQEGEDQLAGQVLNRAYELSPILTTTLENAAYYYAKKGDDREAMTLKLQALNAQPFNPHNAWDGYNFGVNLVDAMNAPTTATTDRRVKGPLKVLDSMDLMGFYHQCMDAMQNQLPENYLLENKDASDNYGEPYQVVCCGCDHAVYTALLHCLAMCKVSLACFTHICTPYMDCCHHTNPFDFLSELCFPPTGLHVCVSGGTNGLNLKIGGSLKGVVDGYLNTSVGFDGSYNVFVSAGTLGGVGAQMTILSSDPHSHFGAISYTADPIQGIKTPTGVTMSANLLDAANWKRGIYCELYMSMQGAPMGQ